MSTHYILGKDDNLPVNDPQTNDPNALVLSNNNNALLMTNIVNNNNGHADVLDPSIMADRETSMHVTAWVRTNYIQEREHNVPRRNMFEHYKAYCNINSLLAVNSATFGKLLRLVFPELKTRRLGVRGQSKYHYCGIRVRTENDVVVANDEPYYLIQQQHAGTSVHTPTSNVDSVISATSSPLPDGSITSSAGPSRKRNAIESGIMLSGGEPSSTEGVKKQTGLPTFIPPSSVTPSRLNYHQSSTIAAFTNVYQNHCKEILAFVTSNQVDRVEDEMRTFYGSMPDSFRALIHNLPEITDAVWRWDCSLYDTMITTFLPTVNHALSPEASKTLRTYTRELRDYLEENLALEYPTAFYQKKSDVARIFTAKFRRQLSLNYASQTAASVLSMHQHLEVMRYDWENFDSEGILDQTLWVCECDTSEIRDILRFDVVELLTTKTNIEDWMEWMSTLIDRYLKTYTPTTPTEAAHYLKHAKQLLLKWTFYTTLIMKGLTLQQANSFGSFHTVRMFLDDYILYLIEGKIAQVNYSLMQQHSMRPSSNFYSPTA